MLKTMFIPWNSAVFGCYVFLSGGKNVRDRYFSSNGWKFSSLEEKPLGIDTFPQKDKILQKNVGKNMLKKKWKNVENWGKVSIPKGFSSK